MREVPAFEVVFERQKVREYCVVIPVINEGRRITSLLARMKALQIERVVDIIIVDGGSTDGSLKPEVLTDLGVSTLLVKRGAGKLSAQLRCGYAYVLDAGYEGVVTIDGNDKDDPAAIPTFVDALKRGCDFVQASRYVPGGVAENTPKVRDLAIRILHAPLLSFFSGFHWTDTTQGFRAYSRRLLLDPRVSIFRDVFQRYELLAYLSYCAPRLGFQCQELPTRRVYPVGEKTPTKISSVRGNLLVFRTLLEACFGFYNPKN
ncbi:glycosyltransferase family 2 protein [Niveibacterium sp.]|uniref:glycosyltransferase family 2 protein n=1 Tax=Niveibacterium sp. TaxID=2017444 RepID=UPI0035AF9F3C